MSLVNKETGQSATEAARQQATNIQLVEQIKALKKDIAAKNIQIAGLKEDKYAADARVESIASDMEAMEKELAKQKEQAKEYEKKYRRERSRPPEKEYYPRCKDCTSQELDKRERELDRMMKEPEAVIQERVKKITARYELEGNLRDFIKDLLYNDIVFFFPMIYFAVEFIITIIKHEPLRMDTINAVKWVWHCITAIFCKLRVLIIAAGGLTGGISNETVQVVLKWVIIVILALVVIAAVLFAVSQIIRFKLFLYYHREEFYGYPFIAFKLALLSLCVHSGKYQVIVEDEYHVNVWAVYAGISVMAVGGILFYRLYKNIYPDR